MSIDHLFNRVYDINTYNCVHFLCEAWKHVTGQNLSHRLEGFLQPASARVFKKSEIKQLTKLEGPADPCIVVLHKPRHSPHVGMFLRGKVLHISALGVQYQPLHVVQIGFNRVSFYQC